MSVSQQSSHGIKRWLKAGSYSFQGLRFAWANESSIREELIAIALLTPLALWLADNGLQAALLIGVLGLVLIVELINSALEAVVDKFEQKDPLFGAAKDMGSAAVLVAVVIAVLTWGLVLLG